VIFRQLTHDDLGCASYLIGDENAGVAAVVDPRLDIDEYLRLARYLGVRIEHVLETHNHADHVSGHGRLVSATGARIHIHPAANAAFAHDPVEHGRELRIGSVALQVVHVPGHTPDSIALLVTDLSRGTEPWFVLTGDTLFVGDVGRPDLRGALGWSAQSLGNMLYDSLRTKLLALLTATRHLHPPDLHDTAPRAALASAL